MLELLLNFRNKLAIHAKRQTVMVHDMQLLRGLWKRINCESAIGADDADTVRQKAENANREKRRVEMARVKACETARRYRAEGKPLPKGLANFLKGINIDAYTLNRAVQRLAPRPMVHAPASASTAQARSATPPEGPAASGTISELLRNRFNR